MSRANYRRKAVRTVRYASRQTGVDFEKWLTWGAVGVVGYLALQAIGLVKSGVDAVSAAKGALNTAGGAIGRTVYDWFHPNQIGESVFYIVRFPDGFFHSVPSLSVDGQGVFKHKIDGKAYRIAVSPTAFVNPNNPLHTTNKQAVLVT
jgi:hypothetical protein